MNASMTRAAPSCSVCSRRAIPAAAVFCGLRVAFFGLPPRAAATTTLATLLSFAVLWVGALAVHWAAASGF